jgi:hypothetical protein
MFVDEDEVAKVSIGNTVVPTVWTGYENVIGA